MVRYLSHIGAMINIKTAEEIEIMKKSCELAAQTLDMIEKEVKPGVSTLKINDLCHDFILDHGAIPSCLDYHGFPKSICTSLNEVICHGIPNEKDIIKEGDILNVDVTCFLNGFHGDTNRTFMVGEVKDNVRKLVEETYECMMIGIGAAKPGAFLGDIGAAIEEHAHKHHLSVVHEYCGHGIGREFHEDPQVLHYGRRGTGAKLKPGMTFTIEPMINLGERNCKLLKDGWTVVTKDRKWSAQFEHTIVITEIGNEILTLSAKGK